MSGRELIALKRAFWLDFLWPPACCGCGQTGLWWCPRCQKELIANWHWRVFSSNRQSSLATALFCADYHQPLLNRLLKQTKYGRLTIPGQVLSFNFADFINQTLARQSWFAQSALTAIPLSHHRHNWRGFNQAELLVQAIAQQCGNQIIKGWRRKNRPQQARLNRVERRTNLDHVFKWSGQSISNLNLIVVDDVLTTGTTLDQAAQCLLRAGARQVRGLTLAH